MNEPTQKPENAQEEFDLSVLQNTLLSLTHGFDFKDAQAKLAELESFKRENQDLRNKLDKLSEKNQALQSELDKLREKDKELQSALDKLTQAFKDVQKENKETTNNYQGLHETVQGIAVGFADFKSQNQALQGKLEGKLDDLTQDFEEKTNDLSKENQGLRHKILHVFVLVLLLIAGILTGYYLLMQNMDTLSNAIKILRQTAALRIEERELKNRAEEVVATVANDLLLRKYYNAGALVYVDCARNFSNKDYIENIERGETIAGNLSIPKFFCKEYYESSSENGFFNASGLKAAFKSLNKGDLSIRSNERFMFTADDNSTLSEKIELLANESLFSLKTLQERPGIFLENLEEKIARYFKDNKNNLNDENFFRFFFATASDGIYLAAIVNNSRLIGCYLAANSPAVSRASISEALKKNLNQIGDGLDIHLLKPDARLNNSVDFDTCIDVFIKQLAERS